MAVWVIADLHLSFGVANKKMDMFGEEWRDHPEKIKAHWIKLIDKDDLILIPGDISWAMHNAEVKPDLEWIDSLPGTKVILKGNHDYWWGTMSKVQEVLPSSIHPIHNNAFHWKDVSVGGVRLWDTQEVQIPYDIYKTNITGMIKEELSENFSEAEKIFKRDVLRLEASLKLLEPSAQYKIVMTHYPPIGLDLKPTTVTALLEKYGVQYCVFGHLHGVKPGQAPFGVLNGVRYALTACDYLGFTPLKIL